MCPGTYTCTITDVNLCQTTHTKTVTQPTAPLTATSVVANVLCNGAATGAIDITVTGGTTNYTYSWVATGGGSLGTNLETAPDLTLLIAGTYTCTITDANGCQTTHTKTVTQPAAALAATSVVTDVLCNGVATGAINLTPSCGTPAYTYFWVASDCGNLGTNLATSEDLDTLFAGTYTCTIRDAPALCPLTVAVVITEPDLLEIDSIVFTHISCFGVDDGEILSIDVLGGTSPFEFSIDGGLPQTYMTFSGLDPGTHTVEVIDANNCVAADYIIIT